MKHAQIDKSLNSNTLSKLVGGHHSCYATLQQNDGQVMYRDTGKTVNGKVEVLEAHGGRGLMNALPGAIKDMNVLIYPCKRTDKGAGGVLKARGGVKSINPFSLHKIFNKRRTR